MFELRDIESSNGRGTFDMTYAKSNNQFLFLSVSISSIASALGNILILLSALWFSKHRLSSWRMFIGLTCANLIVSAQDASVFLTWFLESPDHIDAVLCRVQGMLRQWAEGVTLLYAFFLAWYLFRMFWRLQPSLPIQYELLVHGTSWVAPIPSAVLPYFHVGGMHYGVTGDVCWIMAHPVYGRIVLAIAAVIAVLVATLIFLIGTLILIHRRPPDNPKIQAINRGLYFYPLLAVLVWSPAVFARSLQIGDVTPFGLQVVAATILSSQGFLNGIVYVCTSSTLSHLFLYCGIRNKSVNIQNVIQHHVTFGSDSLTVLDHASYSSIASQAEERNSSFFAFNI